MSGTFGSMNEENWLPVVGFESSYEVSDLGRVRSLIQDKIIDPYAGNQRGHLRISLNPEVGAQRGLYVHRLVLDAFVEPFPKGKECRHLDGDPTNNRLDNLRWGTQSENNLDRVRHGTHQNSVKTTCPKGHPLDKLQVVAGVVKGRRCSECARERNRARRASKTTCPQGHPFDGVRYKADGTVRQRYCTQCVEKALDAGRRGRDYSTVTHCKNGHLFDGVEHRADGSVKNRYCTTCRNATTRRRKEALGPVLCQVAGCQNPKTPGKANQYCDPCRLRTLEARKARARDRARKWYADHKQ